MKTSENSGQPIKFSGRTVAAIIEFSDDKILLVKRGTRVFRGYWALPGGRVEKDEPVEQAIIREVKEETDLDIEIIRKIGEYHEAGVNDNIKYDYYPACFLTKPIGGRINPQKDEIEQIKLFRIKDLPGKLAFKHAQMIHDYKKIKQIIDPKKDHKKNQ